MKQFDSDSQDFNFYGIMGKYFASREIGKELGSQVYNERDSLWYLLYDKSHLLGFCSLFQRTNYLILDNVFVRSEYRNRGYATFLIQSVLEDQSKPIKLISQNPVSNHIYEKFGFEQIGQRGKWCIYMRC